MRKKLLTLMLLVSMLALSGCGKKALEEAQTAVSSYNEAAASYNESIKPYNEAVEAFDSANATLQTSIDKAQDAINLGETPFDENTKTALSDALAAGAKEKLTPPEKAAEYSEMAVNEDAKSDELKALRAESEEKLAEVSALEIPETPQIPDYTEAVKAIDDSLLAYNNSVLSLKQITAPSDDFVIERLQSIDTIQEIQAVTEDHDPNGKLGKQGGYIGTIYFSESRVNKDKVYIEKGWDTVDIGTDGGGAVEVYPDVESALARDSYFSMTEASFGISSGSHYVYGTCIIRTSAYLKASEQNDLTEKILNALTEAR